MNIKCKRAYEAVEEEDGQRILVDRMWPRGISKEKAKIDYWPKELAPSNELRRWYGHSAEKWPEFKSRYFAELDTKPVLMKELLDRLRRGTATFVYSSKERRLNNAAAIRDYIDSISR
jgi:uncharacterized protein YeaO (DUF488 family)